jgi:choline-glycine betaine transporter
MFIARISKGRTIREFVIYVILVPSFVSFVWFSILGGAAFDLQLNQGKDMGAVVDAGMEGALFETLSSYPLGTITSALAVFLIAIFFVTGADSASIVMGMLSQKGCEEPRRGLTVFWGVTTGAVAAVLLWAGGLKALQTLVILVAGPFMLVLIAMCLSTLKSLREEPYESTLPPRVRRAVLHAQRHDRLQHQTIVLATLGCEGPDDGEVSISASPKKESPKVVT